jgi:hypothetical protein
LFIGSLAAGSLDAGGGGVGNICGRLRGSLLPSSGGWADVAAGYACSQLRPRRFRLRLPSVDKEGPMSTRKRSSLKRELRATIRLLERASTVFLLFIVSRSARAALPCVCKLGLKYSSSSYSRTKIAAHRTRRPFVDRDATSMVSASLPNHEVVGDLRGV